LRQVVPACHYIDEPGGVVVLEDAGRDTLASNLSPAPAPDGRTASILAAYGEAIARVHVVRPTPMGETPWLLSALEPVWHNYEWLPRPCAEVLRRLASTPSIRDGFRRARSRWQAHALVHGDLRWANVLVDAAEEQSRVLLVDWELACLGDPSWDLGSALADLVMLLGLPGGRVGDDEFAAWAAPLLAGYVRSLREPARWRALLELAVSMTAIRLVQGLIEIGHIDPNQMAAAEPMVVASISKLFADGGNTATALADAAERSR
jgi:aminoglycoside phosphotransferase (APT) family kinase protein